MSDVGSKVTLDQTENCNEIYDAYMVVDFWCRAAKGLAVRIVLNVG